MKFVDNAVVFVKGGSGGDGAICFRKEKNGLGIKIPNGGDGGAGGNIYLKSDININNLIDFSFKRYYESKDGTRGEGNNACGVSSKNVVVKVPCGTQIFDYNTKEFIGEIFDTKCILVANGGMKGLGNYKLKKFKNDFYDYVKGGLGEFRILKLELKILSDVVLIGLPNCGKSTFIVKISLSKSKISCYPFTTIYPKLGVVCFHHNKFIIADTPGIINNASLGVGLGYEFLKHFVRSKLLLHLLDISLKCEKLLIKDVYIINNEILKYDKNFLYKDIWLVLNKSDLVSKYKLFYIYKYIKCYNQIPIFIISSLRGYGLKRLCKDLSYYLFNS
ncbi:MAG: Obg family GTPase CgtA [Candidatus Azosocius agrarius]|nr:MAG: Obg family GTPase CgtA [Gammaproteobacteria bacterium]